MMQAVHSNNTSISAMVHNVVADGVAENEATIRLQDEVSICWMIVTFVASVVSLATGPVTVQDRMDSRDSFGALQEISIPINNSNHFSLESSGGQEQLDQPSAAEQGSETHTLLQGRMLL